MGIEKIITSISTGTSAGLGNLLTSNDKSRIDKTVDMFEFLQGGATTILYTITAIMPTIIYNFKSEGYAIANAMHNMFLESLVEIGILGFIVYSIMVFSFEIL